MAQALNPSCISLYFLWRIGSRAPPEYRLHVVAVRLQSQQDAPYGLVVQVA